MHENGATSNGVLANGNASVTHTPIVIKSSGKIDALVDMAYTELGKARTCYLACVGCAPAVVPLLVTTRAEGCLAKSHAAA